MRFSPTEIVIALATLIASIVSIVAYVTSVRNARDIDRQKCYSDIDYLYLKVLELRVRYPSLADPARVGDYQNRFTGDDLLRYDAYAFMVWNICETVYDTCKGDKELWKTWEPVIHAEAELHASWLRNNRTKFKQLFLDYVGTLC